MPRTFCAFCVFLWPRPTRKFIVDVALAALTPNGVGILKVAQWPVLTEEQRQASFVDILRAFDAHAIPWFNRITTRKGLASVIHPSNPHDMVNRIMVKTVAELLGALKQRGVL